LTNQRPEPEQSKGIPGAALPADRRPRRGFGTVPGLVLMALLIAILGTPLSGRARESQGIPLLGDRSSLVSDDEVWAVTQDAAGILYFGTGSGVIEYDGASARRHSLANESIVRSLAAHPSGSVFVGGIGEVGVLTRDDTGMLRYSPLHDPDGDHLDGLRDVWRMWPTDEGFIAWTLGRILEWNGRAFSSVAVVGRTMPAMVSGRLLLVDPAGGVAEVADGSIQPIGKVEGINQERIFSWMQHPDGSGVLGTINGHLWHHTADALEAFLSGDRATLVPTRLMTDADPIMEEHRLYQGIALSNGGFAVSTMSGGAIIFDPEGAAVFFLDRDTGLPDNSVWTVFEDRDRGLWLGLSRGLARAAIEIPMAVYDDRLGLEGKVQAVVRGQDRLWACTTTGVFGLGAGGFQQMESIAGPCWSLLAVEDSGGRRVFAGAAHGVFEVGARPRHLSEIRHAFAIVQSSDRPDHVWVGYDGGIAALSIGTGPPSVQDTIIRDVGVQVRSIAEGAEGTLWLGTLILGVLRARDSDPDHLDRADIETMSGHGLDNPNSIKLFNYQESVYAATGDGLMVWRPDLNRFVASHLLDPIDGGIARVAVDGSENLWISRDEKTPVWLDPTSRAQASAVFRHLPSQDVYSFFPEPGQCWLATAEGIIRYLGTPDDRFVEAPPHRRISLREIAVDDQRQPLDLPLVLDSRRRRVVIRWSIPGADIAVERPFRYRVRGLDASWSKWTEQNHVEYTHLSGGRFTFEVEARDLQGRVFTNLTVPLRIPHPWYFTWVGAVLALAASAGLVVVGMRVRTIHHRRERRRLEEQVRIRTAELEEAKEEARAAATAKGRFLATMSHEIRTPLTSVLGAIDLMNTTDLDDDQRRFLRIVRTSGKALVSLVNSVLDHARIEAGEVALDLGDLDLRDVIADTLEILSVDANRKGIDLDTTIDERIPAGLRGDQGKLRQILINLVGNAVKFTESGSVLVSAVLRASSETSASIRFMVQDTGPGIPEHELDRLFQPFSQLAGSRTRGARGTGLGLVISRQLVELMGGLIGVESTEGVGTMFWFYLEMERSPDVGTAASRLNQATRVSSLASEALAILLVEDDAVGRIVTKALLEDAGYRVTAVGTAQDALGMLFQTRFDAVLTDITMPDMDGIELARRIRQHDLGRRLPIIAVTGRAMAGDRETLLASGMDAYVSKPVRSKELLRTVRELLLHRPD
jgi:signal transduction histidine kinase/CheY-like chemotaxis protein/ligand-binding sensor domain-containing protein